MSSFTESDRDRIRAELVEAGRELFARFGFERTRIKDVTEVVGIGTSTFYQFFDSKEALYVVVLSAEQEAVEAIIEAAVEDAETPKDEVRLLLQTMFTEVRSNPLIARLIVEGELRKVQEQLSEAERRSISTPSSGDAITLAERWAQMDEFRYDDPELIRGLFRSLVFVTRSQEALLGAVHVEAYEQVEERLIETVTDGLFID